MNVLVDLKLSTINVMETETLFCLCTVWSATGDIHEITPLYQEEERSPNHSPASNINQPVPVHAAGQSVGHAVKAANQQAPSDESADTTHFG